MKSFIIHNQIRGLRYKQDEMTQQELADLVGVTRQTIIALEKGKFYPSLELAFRISRSFLLPLEEVFQFEFKDEKGKRKKLSKKA